MEFKRCTSVYQTTHVTATRLDRSQVSNHLFQIFGSILSSKNPSSNIGSTPKVILHHFTLTRDQNLQLVCQRRQGRQKTHSSHDEHLSPHWFVSAIAAIIFSGYTLPSYALVTDTSPYFFFYSGLVPLGLYRYPYSQNHHLSLM